ncbi:MAG: hypothetical protein AMXMBFR78_16630 [Rubrivivax sp.]
MPEELSLERLSELVIERAESSTLSEAADEVATVALAGRAAAIARASAAAKVELRMAAGRRAVGIGILEGGGTVGAGGKADGQGRPRPQIMPPLIEMICPVM